MIDTKTFIARPDSFDITIGEWIGLFGASYRDNILDKPGTEVIMSRAKKTEDPVTAHNTGIDWNSLPSDEAGATD